MVASAGTWASGAVGRDEARAVGGGGQVLRLRAWGERVGGRGARCIFEKTSRNTAAVVAAVMEMVELRGGGSSWGHRGGCCSGRREGGGCAFAVRRW